jgi:glycosyltransferase involved in cell wall biosynthesis
MSRPRALLVAPLAPDLTGNGLAMRLGMFLEALHQVAETELLVLPIAGKPAQESGLARTLGIPAATIPVAGRADTNFTLLSRVQDPAERLAAFKRYGRGSRHALVSLPVLEAIRAHTAGRGFDMIHASRLYVAEAALAVGGTHHTLDLDEDDAWAWRRRAELQRVAGEDDASLWCEAEAAAEDRLLERIGGRFDALFIASAADRDRLVTRHPDLSLDIAPNGVTFPSEPRHADDGKTLLFVGNLGYEPNIEGILWFAHEVLPRVLTNRDVRLRIVGSGRSDAIDALRDHPRIEVVGAVDDVAPAYEAATVAVAPLLSGAGTRIKLIEAAAFEVPIVATSIAAQGLDLAPGAIWCADTADGFAFAVLEALAEPAERVRRAGKVRAAAQARYERARLVEALASRFDQILSTGLRLRG